MRQVAAAIVLLAGAVIVGGSAGRLDTQSAPIGLLIGLVGIVAWVVSYFTKGESK